MNIYVLYDSEAGHTAALARAVAEGAKSVPDAHVVLKHVSEANVRDLVNMDAIIWGCPGHFGTISSGLKAWIDQLGYMWAQGDLVGKIGAAFCTTATVHGGIEMTLWNLLTPMLHNGMILVGLPGNLQENVLYGSYYGVGITCPVDLSSDNSKDPLTASDIALGRALGKRVAEVTQKFVS